MFDRVVKKPPDPDSVLRWILIYLGTMLAGAAILCWSFVFSLTYGANKGDGQAMGFVAFILVSRAVGGAFWGFLLAAIVHVGMILKGRLTRKY